jgi:peptide-methionine (S)-S-oxide reductase
VSTETATLGGGCFWCLEAAYQEVNGITSVTSGYAGGHQPHPRYQQVCTGTTGHAEVVQLAFDPTIISYPEVLDIFWALHDPTTRNRQGHDVGPQYRSIILYHGDRQRQQAEASRQQIQAAWPDPVVTEIVPLKQFWPAEAEHQNYYRNHLQQGYCQLVINPKLVHLREAFSHRLRQG